MLNTQNIAMLFFLVTVVKLNPAIAGLIITLSKLYDAFTDPIMGTISDQTRSRWGRRRPYLLLGGIGCGVGFAALFWVPIGQSDVLIYSYVIVTLLLMATAYTVFNVPYLAMPVEMVDGYNDRSVLMSYRVFFISIATYAATSGSPALLSLLQDYFQLSPRDAYRVMGVTFGAAIAAAMIGSFYGTRNAAFTENVPSSIGLWKRLKLIAENRPFVLFMGIKLCGLFAFAAILAGKFFFVTYIMQRPLWILGIFGTASVIGQLIALPPLLKMAKRYGKVSILALSAVLMMVFTLSWFMSGPEETLWVYGLRGLLLGMAAAGTLLGAQAILPDVMEYDYRRTGLRREGIFAGVASFIEKTSFALSAVVIGGFLEFMDFDRNLPADQQPESALFAIMACTALLPTALYGIKLILLYFFDLDEAKLKGTQPAAITG